MNRWAAIPDSNRAETNEPIGRSRTRNAKTTCLATNQVDLSRVRRFLEDALSGMFPFGREILSGGTGVACQRRLKIFSRFVGREPFILTPYWRGYARTARSGQARAAVTSKYSAETNVRPFPPLLCSRQSSSKSAASADCPAASSLKNAI